MLTVREVETAVAEMLKASPVSTAHYIRTLKEAGLWFRVGRGRTEAPLEAKHLVNVVLAFVSGAPADGPETVKAFREFQLDSIRIRPDGDESLDVQAPVNVGGVTIYPTLGETLDHLAKGAAPKITVTIEAFGAIGVTVFVDEAEVWFLAPASEAKVPETPMISHVIMLLPALFKRMAELIDAADSRPPTPPNPFH